MKAKCTDPSESYNVEDGPEGTAEGSNESLRESLYEEGYWWSDSDLDDLLKLVLKDSNGGDR